LKWAKRVAQHGSHEEVEVRSDQGKKKKSYEMFKGGRPGSELLKTYYIYSWRVAIN
jgi:hypothetical protein